eukprot:gene7598-9342_t
MDTLNLLKDSTLSPSKIIGCKRKSTSSQPTTPTKPNKTILDYFQAITPPPPPAQNVVVTENIDIQLKNDKVNDINNNNNNNISKIKEIIPVNKNNELDKKLNLESTTTTLDKNNIDNNIDNDEKITKKIKLDDSKSKTLTKENNKIKEKTSSYDSIDSPSRKGMDMIKMIASKSSLKEWDWKSASKKVFSADESLNNNNNNIELEQTLIDAGQKMGQIECKKCRMVYFIGSKEDENIHQSYCKSITTQKVVIKNWRNTCKILNTYPKDHAIVVLSSNDLHSSLRSKIKTIKDIVDLELGYRTTSNYCKKKKNQDDEEEEKIFLYLDSNGRILGCLIAERVEIGFRIIDTSTLQCKKDPSKILCGISRIWTLSSHRNQGIAYKLMESLRCNMYYGFRMEKNQIAVSQPSTDGIKFFGKYFSTPNFILFDIGY